MGEYLQVSFLFFIWMDPLDFEAPPEKREFPMDQYVPGSYTRRNVMKWDRSKEGNLSVGDDIVDVPVFNIETNSSTEQVFILHSLVTNISQFVKDEGKYYILNFGSYS